MDRRTDICDCKVAFLQIFSQLLFSILSSGKHSDAPIEKSVEPIINSHLTSCLQARKDTLRIKCIAPSA